MGGMKKSGCHAILIVILLAMAPLYVLSSGPAAFLVDNTQTPSSVLMVYWPLASVHRVSKPLGEAWWWYINLWSNNPSRTTSDR